MLKYIFRAILLFFGWSLLSEDVLTKMNKYKRAVLVFSHTSYCDFYIMALYLLAYPQYLGFVNVLMKPQPFEYAGGLLRFFGGIPATKVENKNGGSTMKTVEELRKKKRSYLLLSPKGTIVKKEWRTGYYYIAKELEAPIMVVGLDFETKDIYLSSEVFCDKEEPVVRKLLYEDLKNIVPLYPEEEVVEIRKHDESKRSFVSLKNTYFLGILILGFCANMYLTC